jgi:hypothetical protein
MKMDQQLLETDQFHCYSQEGRQIACDGTGQDGSDEKRFNQAVHDRFQVMDHVVEDRLTSVIWSRDANPAQFPLTWREAQQFVAEMRARRAHGYGNWRLPARRLLFSLISHQNLNPALPEGHPFENIFTGYYWAAETCRRLTDQAWYVHLGGGRIHRGMKHGSYMVWPVAADHGQPDAADRFAADDCCVYDSRTGRTWSRDADRPGGRLSWQDALSAVQSLNAEKPVGERDWRLPNIRELESLVDLESHSPALPAGHPFVNVRDAYWSSTTSVYEPRYAWTVYSQDGIVGVGFKPQADFYVWPVRSG